MDTDQGKLFVGGISWETTEENLSDYFQRYGNIVETVIMKDRNTGRARGFGFISFADPAAADMALLDKHTINGRLVEAKKAVPRDEQQTMPRSSSLSSGGQSPGGQGRTKKIFVGGLASTVTEEEFRGYFEQFGTISDAVVMYDHTTQRPRGFGFITFDSEDSVDAVLMKPFHELKEKMVEVKRAVPRDQTPTVKSPVNTFGGGSSRAYGQGGGGGGGGGYPSPGIYGGRPDARFGGMPARGAYPYPAGGYPGYAGAGYVMNGNYPGGYPGAYGGAAGYGGTGYGGNAAGYGNGGATSPGYASTPNRNAWPGAGAYGGTQGYAGYGTGMWGSASQNPGQGGSNYMGYYGSSENGYGSNAGAAAAGGYGGRGSGYGGSPGGYGAAGSGSYASGNGGGGGGGGGSYSAGGYEGYGGSSGYAEGSWNGEGYNGGGSAAGNGSFEDVGGGSAAENAGGAGYGGGYGSAATRQSQRGNAADTRFRPYPTASDRS